MTTKYNTSAHSELQLKAIISNIIEKLILSSPITQTSPNLTIERLMTIWNDLDTIAEDPKLAVVIRRIIDEQFHEALIERQLRDQSSADAIWTFEDILGYAKIDWREASMVLNDPDFPKPLNLNGIKAIRWRSSDIIEYFQLLPCKEI